MRAEDLVVALFFIGVLVPVVLLIRGSRRKAGPLSLPYQKRKFFFTRAEQLFFEHLVAAVGRVGRGHVVLAKTRMTDLLMMTKGTTGKAYWAAWGRISQKHADFVILQRVQRPGEPDYLEPVLVIELDDSSHQQEQRQQRDALVDAIYAQAGLPIWHVPVAYSYDTGAITTAFRQFLERRPAPAATATTSASHKA